MLRRSTGDYTYFASDIAYHLNKLGRDYDRVIDVVGADHHGYLGRMRAVWQALGGDVDRFEILIMQLVNLSEGASGSRCPSGPATWCCWTICSTTSGWTPRAGSCCSEATTLLDLDLELARRESQDNPVYYVQYAHARIASILRKAGDERVRAAMAADLTASSERFIPPRAHSSSACWSSPPRSTRRASAGPHRLTTYAHETARSSPPSIATAAWWVPPRREATRTCAS